MTEALERLLRLAHKRSKADEPDLRHYARTEAAPGVRSDQPIVPESMALGFHTGFWADLSETERLALNHWTYSLMYTRINDGERYVLAANREISAFIRPRWPAIADLLDREVREEVDHIAAFSRVKAVVDERLGIGGLRPPRKPLRKVIVHPATTRALLRWFGSDYVVLYFTGRGIANHMGKGFETPLSRSEGGNAEVTRLTLLHTIDESNHMAVSRLIAASGRELGPTGEAPRGALYRRLFQALLRSTVVYTFSEGYSKGQERKMARQALHRLKALRGRSAGFLDALIEAHFESVSGIERSRNAYMPKPNGKLIEGAALAESEKQLWRDLLVANQGNLRFLAA